MNLKKLLLFSLIAGSLGLAAYWTIKKNQRKSTLDKLDLNFAVPDTSSISKIVITQFQGKAMVLRRDKGYWMLNEKYKVAPVLMDVLLTTIRNVEMQRPLAPNESKTVLEAMKKRNRKVEIFVNDESYKTYYLGDDAPENRGTYFKMENGEPFVCHLRAFTGFLTPRYNVSEKEWRDRLLFSSTPQTLQSVEIKYNRSPADNFKILFSGKHFQLESAQRFDTLAAAQYLLNYKRVYTERYLSSFTKKDKDSLFLNGYDWSIDLVDIDKLNSHSIKIWNTESEDRSLAYLSKSDEWVTIQKRNLAPLQIRRLDLASKNN